MTALLPRPLARAAVLAASLLLLPLFTPAAVSAAAGPTLLFPNMQTLPPRDLRFANANVSSDPAVVNTHRVLQFSNTVMNMGDGPLDLFGHIDSTLNPPSGPAYQRVYDTSGGHTDYPVGTFAYHAVHQHYHYQGWGAYELWTKADYAAWLASGRSAGLAKYIGSKTTSCGLDEEFVRALPNTPFPGIYDGSGCQTDSAGNLHMGISPGWGDTYDWYRFEQWIDLGANGGLSDGEYVLRSVTDPNNQLYESPGKTGAVESQQDNEATTAFTVSGGQLLDTGLPTGSLSANGVDAVTTAPHVTLRSVGRDDVSGIDSFRVSNDGATWAPPFSYTTSGSFPTVTSWDMTDSRYGGTAAGGQKTIYEQFHDLAGHWGPTTTATIMYTPLASGPTYGSVVLGDAPVAAWRLGDASAPVAADAVGSHPGTYAGGVTLGAPGLLTGDSNTAVALDGASGRMSVPDGSGLSPPSLSVEAWIKPAALPAAGTFASVLTKAESYSLQFNGSMLEWTLVSNSGTRARLQAPVGTIAVGGVYHVVGTFDGTTTRLFVNGSQVATGLPGFTQRVTASPVIVGSWDGSSEFFHGTVDEAALYPTALSQTRISAHYGAGTTASSASGYPLTVTTKGTGAGSVLSSPAGISCPPTCTATFPSTSGVTLTETPASGSTFSGWTGACSGTTPSCTVSTYAATSVGATFNTSASGPTYGSVVLGDAPVAAWRLGDASAPVAADAVGSHPGTYAGGVTLGAPGLLTGDSNTAVALDGASGRMSVPDGSGLSPPSLSVEAWIKPAALPAAGTFASVLTKAESYSLQFNGSMLEWTLVSNSGTRARLQAPVGTIAVGGVYHVVGTFDGTTTRLFVNGSQVATGLPGFTQRVTASPVIVGSWDGSSEFFHGTVDEAALYPTALSQTRISAHYGAGTTASSASGYPLTVTTKGTGAGSVLSSPAGISCPPTCTATFPSTSGVTLTETPASGSTFSGWTGACSGTTPSCTVSTYAATSVGATFNTSAGTTYSLSVTRGGSGTGTVTSTPGGISCGATCSASYPSGTSVTLSAAAASGSSFTGWAGACTGASATCTISMTAAQSLSATFAAAVPPPASTYASTVGADAPVSFWRLGESSGTVAADVEMAHPGTFLGGSTLGAAGLLAGDPSTAVAFDGTSGRMSVPNGTGLTPASLSVEAWIHPLALPATGAFASVLSKAESYSLQFNGPRLEWTLINASATRARLQAPVGAITVGGTYHVVGTFDGSTSRLYINGSLVATGTPGFAPRVTSSALLLGSWDGSSEFFRGTVDEAALYATALSGTRVSAHYSAGKGS